MRKTEIRQYLRFNLKEGILLSALMLLIAFLFSFPYFFKEKDNTAPVIISGDKSEPEITHKKEQVSEDKRSFFSNDLPAKTGKLFYFDPNTASFEEWQTLGLRDRTIKTIKNYLAKGGSFRKKEDLQKIYGLHPDQYERLARYIKIESKQSSQNYSQQSPAYNYTASKPWNKENLAIKDINTADAAAFIALPGIGEKLANRIMNFREKLGGFYSVEQVKETYALPDSTFQLIKPLLHVSQDVRKLNINTATKDDLKVHPYIRWNIANAIVEYRNQHGVFKSLDELKNIMLIDEDTFHKLLPYLSL